MAAVDNSDSAFLAAKAFLLKSDGEGVSAYDHLSEVLLKVLETKPTDALQSIEKISQDVKRDRLKATVKSSAPRRSAPALPEVYQRQAKLFSKGEGEDEASTITVPNIVKEAQLYEQCGLGIGHDEIMHIQFAMRKLASSLSNVQSIRLWGKIIGTNSDYIIVEGTPAEGVEFDEADSAEDDASANAAAPSADDGGADPSAEDDDSLEMQQLQDAPKSQFKPTPPIPREVMSGANKHWYWVTSEPGQPWVKLPSVSPSQIAVSRKIKKLFSGNLEAPVHSYPPFDGKEKHLLRAQIARITAATVVSPAGYFAFPEDQDEDDEERVNVEAVPDYEGMALEELAKAESWAHHSGFILPQGRCQWYSPIKEHTDEDDEQEEEEEDVAEEVEPETGPLMLTSCAEDRVCSPQAESAWSAKVYPSYSPDIVCIRSNNWPGAAAIATDRGTFFRNIYFGWGIKYSAQPYMPSAIQSVLSECEVQLTQVADPSVEEEMALEEEREDKEGNDLGDDNNDSDDDDDD